MDPDLRQRGGREQSELLRSLGHEVVEIEPPWQLEGLQAICLQEVFCTQISLSIAYSGHARRARGSPPSGMEPMSWAIYSMVRKLEALQAVGAGIQLQAFARGLIGFLEPYDALLTPGPGGASAAAGHARHRRAGPDVDVHSLGPVHPFHPRHQRHRFSRRSRCRCSRARMGCLERPAGRTIRWRGLPARARQPAGRGGTVGGPRRPAPDSLQAGTRG